MKELLYAVRCLKSNEDMILALAGQFKQLSHEPEKFTVLIDNLHQNLNTQGRHPPHSHWLVHSWIHRKNLVLLQLLLRQFPHHCTHVVLTLLGPHLPPLHPPALLHSLYAHFLHFDSISFLVVSLKVGRNKTIN